MANLPWRVSVRLMALAKKIGMVVGIVLVVLLAVRVYLSQQGPELHLWHTWRADEMSVREMDNADFARYIARENAIFADLDNAVTAKTEGEERTPLNRYYRQSLVWPGQFTPDANRSFVLMPAGKPRGAVVLLHGLTDSPYSVRRLAVNYQQHGFVAVVPRLPGHGTAPGALTDVDWEMWLAATRLAVREATRLAGEAAPLHLVGYSNGGALAMKYALDALDAPALRKPQQVILLSPMIGVTAFARFAGFAGLPALLPAFAKAAWLNISPEYNPYKYNSFPVNAARQSWLLTKALQEQISREARENRLANLPPILAFQSVMDSTVSTRAVVTGLFDQLPANGSELVVFDINQAASFRPLFKPSSWTATSALLPVAQRRYGVTIITNASEHSFSTVAKITPAGSTRETVVPLAQAWPQDVYSLSHVAVPFPPDDDLYGREPRVKNRYGISLGTIALWGETSVLSVGKEALMRVTSNPFYDYIQERIDSRIGNGEK
ncbi:MULTISPECIES: alpha/beta hydrolase [Enterobacter]|jgi:alpha-beta hydrolase superfamily lysophospholipase|uniref:alpha/beta hydrolase n=1 Tax=Enterobacter TaxID=547 RepID=UPI000845FD1B|nr:MULTISPECIES: alpha/beta hydrolase [Enterobacter]MDP9552065.1 alpha-beta hydrolase superfamily lysophospholipase [Enterobacter mori]SHG19936.1 Serine aminopeptidase, S33 [Pantoea sesami]AOL11916.1 Thermostable monoacylglycerol lipase [Enterobacter sp. HK169]MBL5946955.1 alpha/beta hydrolase [Enterobacter asburiae]MBS0843440.1 alpha/beta hydrolase [Enterobacter asburiae]